MRRHLHYFAKRVLSVTFISLILVNCTSHFHHGYTHYDVDDRRCEAMVYWHDTTTWFNNEHEQGAIIVKQASTGRAFIFADPIRTAVNAKSNLRSTLILSNDLFTQTDFAQSMPLQHEQSNMFGDTEINCGTITLDENKSTSRLETASFSFYCNPLSHPLKPIPMIIPASQQPYVFVMEPVTSKFSLWGEHPVVNVKLTCSPLSP